VSFTFLLFLSLLFLWRKILVLVVVAGRKQPGQLLEDLSLGYLVFT
jgi:hypothetical protein